MSRDIGGSDMRMFCVQQVLASKENVASVQACVGSNILGGRLQSRLDLEE